jgi:hypothetical protein
LSINILATPNLLDDLSFDRGERYGFSPATMRPWAVMRHQRRRM